MNIIYFGIDPSLNSTGISAVDRDGIRLLASCCPMRITSGRYSLENELYKIQSVVEKVAENVAMAKSSKNYDVAVAAIEGVFYHSIQQSQMATAGLHFLLRDRLEDWGIDFIVVPPTTLKKFFYGDGKFKKNDLVDGKPAWQGVSDKLDLSAQTSDEVDAYGLALMAREYFSGDKSKVGEACKLIKSWTLRNKKPEQPFL